MTSGSDKISFSSVYLKKKKYNKKRNMQIKMKKCVNQKVALGQYVLGKLLYKVIITSY